MKKRNTILTFGLWWRASFCKEHDVKIDSVVESACLTLPQKFYIEWYSFNYTFRLRVNCYWITETGPLSFPNSLLSIVRKSRAYFAIIANLYFFKEHPILLTTGIKRLLKRTWTTIGLKIKVCGIFLQMAKYDYQVWCFHQ